MQIDKIIQIIRESMVANAPGAGGGFSNSSDSSGPTAGYDSPLSTLKVFKRDNKNDTFIKKILVKIGRIRWHLVLVD